MERSAPEDLPVAVPPAPRPPWMRRAIDIAGRSGGTAVARALFAALWIALAATSATRVLRDVPALEGPVAGTNEPDAANYCAGPRLAANGVPLERTHTFYVMHAAPLAVVAAPIARLAPSDSHRAIRLGTVVLHILLSGIVGWGVVRGRRAFRSPWMLAALAGWCLSPGMWGLARLAYSEYYVGLALGLALLTLPRLGATHARVALGGLGTGVLLTSKSYGAAPLILLVLLLGCEDLRLRRLPTRALVFAAAALLTAAATWGAACVLVGLSPTASLGDFLGDMARFRIKYGLDLHAALEALPRVLSARLPGFEWHGVVLLALFRWGTGARGIAPRLVAVWFGCFIAPYTASPFSYRLLPLLVALPALAWRNERITSDPRLAAPRWPALLVDTLWVSNLLRVVHPDLLESRSRWLPVAALAIVAAAHAWSRSRRAAQGTSQRLPILPLAAAAAWLAMVVHGLAWQASNWLFATYRWDDSAKIVARLAPDTPSIAGFLPELWCRYLPHATSLDTMTAIAPLPQSRMASSPVVLIPSNHLDYYGSWLEGREVTQLPVPLCQGPVYQLEVGIRR